jgi:hypothetical protein
MARTTWWSSEWARWFGWTLVFALVAGACNLAYEVSIGCKGWPKGLPVVADACGLADQALGPGILPAWSLAYLVPPLVAAFFIGVRFPFVAVGGGAARGDVPGRDGAPADSVLRGRTAHPRVAIPGHDVRRGNGSRLTLFAPRHDDLLDPPCPGGLRRRAVGQAPRGDPPR